MMYEIKLRCNILEVYLKVANKTLSRRLIQKKFEYLFLRI